MTGGHDYIGREEWSWLFYCGYEMIISIRLFLFYLFLHHEWFKRFSMWDVCVKIFDVSVACFICGWCWWIVKLQCHISCYVKLILIMEDVHLMKEYIVARNKISDNTTKRQLFTIINWTIEHENKLAIYRSKAEEQTLENYDDIQEERKQSKLEFHKVKLNKNSFQNPQTLLFPFVGFDMLFSIVIYFSYHSRKAFISFTTASNDVQWSQCPSFSKHFCWPSEREGVCINKNRIDQKLSGSIFWWWKILETET